MWFSAEPYKQQLFHYFLCNAMAWQNKLSWNYSFLVFSGLGLKSSQKPDSHKSNAQCWNQAALKQHRQRPDNSPYHSRHPQQHRHQNPLMSHILGCSQYSSYIHKVLTSTTQVNPNNHKQGQLKDRHLTPSEKQHFFTKLLCHLGPLNFDPLT